MGIIYQNIQIVSQKPWQVHCNEKFPEHMNMYISNLRNNFIMVYEENDWKVKDREDVFNFIINDKNTQLEEWLDEQRKYPEMSEKFKFYMNVYSKDNDSINKK